MLDSNSRFECVCMYVCMYVCRLVGDKYIEFSNGERLNYGFCVWAAGNGPIPFVLDTIEKVHLL